MCGMCDACNVCAPTRAYAQAASDCLRALLLVLGPLCEPEGVWDAADGRSLTARCARVLDGARFDKVGVNGCAGVRARASAGGGGALWGR